MGMTDSDDLEMTVRDLIEASEPVDEPPEAFVEAFEVVPIEVLEELVVKRRNDATELRNPDFEINDEDYAYLLGQASKLEQTANELEQIIEDHK